MRLFSTLLLLCLCHIANASYFKVKTPYQVCFTPGANCTHLLVDHIKKAKHLINAQIYSFTSYKIARALVDAKRRGVRVTVIFDRSNFKKKYFSFAPYLKKHGIACYVDEGVKSIAHNKVMIIDHSWVETGSFNFTKAAQTKNAENMLLIQSAQLNHQFDNNFQKRLKQSRPCH